MRFIRLTRHSPGGGSPDTNDPYVDVNPEKIVRMLRILPNAKEDNHSYTHVGYGWSYGTNSEICDQVVETREQIKELIKRLDREV